MPKTVLLEKRERVALVTLNRPEALNAMDLQVRQELKEIFHEVNFEQQIGAVVLQGAGRSFCAGGDIKTMGGYAPGQGRIRLKNLHYMLRALALCEKPTIAAVNGFVAGAGLSLALACDLRVAAEDTKFVASFLQVGLIPDSGSLYFLPRVVGMAKAKEIFLTAGTLDVVAAKEAGLVNKISTLADFRADAWQLAQELAQKPAVAVSLTKSILNRSFELDLDQVLDFEALAQDVCFNTPDHLEGINAFRQKRKPKFNQ